jgi:hypothetical protein
MAKKKTSSKTHKSTKYRSAKSGQYVTKEYANKNPRTTIKAPDEDNDGTDHTGPRRR